MKYIFFFSDGHWLHHHHCQCGRRGDSDLHLLLLLQEKEGWGEGEEGLSAVQSSDHHRPSQSLRWTAGPDSQQPTLPSLINVRNEKSRLCNIW